MRQIFLGNDYVSEFSHSFTFYLEILVFVILWTPFNTSLFI